MLTDSRLLVLFVYCLWIGWGMVISTLEMRPCLQVTPTALDAGVICADSPHVETVYLANAGDLLEIHELKTAGGWEVLHHQLHCTFPSENGFL